MQSLCKNTMIVDDIKITVEAGHGGRGLSTFSKIKFMKGPTGGNGGFGGSVFIEGVTDLGALRQFRFKKDLKARDGENGKSGLHDGSNADDLTLLVPVGTICTTLILKKILKLQKLAKEKWLPRVARVAREIGFLDLL